MNSWTLQSAIVPVSGAASGIGLAICKRLRAEGATPLLLDLDHSKLVAAVREVYPEVTGGEASRLSYKLDVRDSKAVDACFDAIRTNHGPVTHAVANAGVTGAGHVLELSDAQWHQVIDVNLNGVFYFCRAAARQLAERKSGAIVATASIAGLSAKEARAAYASSKAAVVNMTRALAIDLGAFGVRVNGVAPGIIETPMQVGKSPEALDALRARVPLKRLGAADEVAKVVHFLLSEMASYVTGQTIVIDGGLTVRYA
jgi:3-oxoacyl-[acyl-carrier protein] reductase